MLTIVILIIFFALVFDFLNGFHDAANSIATIVSTRVLTPLQAVCWAAFFNFIAAFTFGVGVATTIGKGVIRPEGVSQGVILEADRGDRLEHHHLVSRPAYLLLPRAHRGFAGAALTKRALRSSSSPAWRRSAFSSSFPLSWGWPWALPSWC